MDGPTGTDETGGSTFAHVLRYADRADRDVIDMVNGAPDWEPPAPLRDGLRAAAEAAPADMQYPPTRGLGALREEVAARRAVEEAGVVVTGGATEANHVVTAHALARGAGEEVVMADPYYPYWPRRVRLLGGTPVTVPVDDGGRLDPDAVAAAVGPETAAVMVATPNNPTGAVYGRDRLRALTEVAADADALLVSDETYGHLDCSGEFVSALTVDSDHRVVVSSFSKSLAATGLRVGYLVAPTPHREPLVDRHELTAVAASRPAQAAVAHALRETGPDYHAAVRDRLADRLETFLAALDGLGADYERPAMPFYVLARIPGLDGDLTTVERLVDEAGVAAMPGTAFGQARADHLRFALVTPRVETAAERLGAVDPPTDG